MIRALDGGASGHVRGSVGDLVTGRPLANGRCLVGYGAWNPTVHHVGRDQ